MKKLSSAYAFSRNHNLVFLRRLQDLNHSHHSSVLVLQDMAVIGESAYYGGISKVDAKFDAGIGRNTIPIGHIYRIAEVVLTGRFIVSLDQDEVRLMDVKSVRLLRAILDHPIFHFALPDCDVGSSRGIEDSGLLSFFSHVESGRSARVPGIQDLFGEIQFSSAIWLDIFQRRDDSLFLRGRVFGDD